MNHLYFASNVLHILISFILALIMTRYLFFTFEKRIWLFVTLSFLSLIAKYLFIYEISPKMLSSVLEKVWIYSDFLHRFSFVNLFNTIFEIMSYIALVYGIIIPLRKHSSNS